MTAAKEDWFSAFASPRCVLVSLRRAGKRVAKGQTEVVLERIHRWSVDPVSVFSEAQLRSRGPAAPASPSDQVDRFEKAALSALRLGDVRKSIQVLNSAPFAPPGEETLRALRDLHPDVPPPSLLASPSPKVPFFQEA